MARNALAGVSLDPRIAAEIGRRTANPGDPRLAELYAAAMRDNPGNPWMVGPRQRAALDEKRTAWDSQFAPGGAHTSIGQMTFGANPVDARSYLSDFNKAVEASPGVQNAILREPAGTGLFGDPILGTLFSAALAMAGPAAAALGGISQSKNNPLGSLLSLAGPTIGPGLYDKAKNALSGGFSNPSALGLSGANLDLPGLANAPGTSPVAGYGASGLGLTGANLGLNFASGGFPGAPVKGYGASAVGGNPESLYPGKSGLPDLPGMPGGPSLGGPSEAPRSAVTTAGVSGPSAPGAPAMPRGQGLDPILQAAGKMPTNALLASGMGAGLMGLSGRDLYRNPGYQPPPFANFLRAA